MTAVRITPHELIPDTWAVSFGYDGLLVDIVKSYPNHLRSWNPETKRWLVHDSIMVNMADELTGDGGATVFGFDKDHFKRNRSTSGGDPFSDPFDDFAPPWSDAAWGRANTRPESGPHWGRYEPDDAAERIRKEQERLRRTREEQARRDRARANRPPSTRPVWAETLFLAVGPDRTEAVFRALIKVLHPDNPKTGNADLTRVLIEARDKATK